MSEERAAPVSSRRVLVVLAAGAAVIAALWLSGARTAEVLVANDQTASPEHALSPSAVPHRSAPPASAHAPAQRAAEDAFTARAFAGPGPDDPAGPGMLPHPITAEHLRIYRDVDLLQGASAALKQRDFVRARSLLAQHAREYPSSYDDLNDGLSILADCMETKSADARARAQAFYDRHTSSTARRKIRRDCLEQVPAPEAEESTGRREDGKLR